MPSWGYCQSGCNVVTKSHGPSSRGPKCFWGSCRADARQVQNCWVGAILLCHIVVSMHWGVPLKGFSVPLKVAWVDLRQV